MRRSAPPPGPAAMAAAAAAVFAWLVARLWPFTVDDSYITLRYARNLARGLGPTFNATGPRAEGYSSPLWTLLMVPPHLLGLDAPAFAKLVGVACAALTFALAGVWAAREADAEGGGRWAGPAAALLLAAIPPTAVHAVSGMETSLFTLLVTTLFACAAAALRDPGGRAFRVLPVAALLVSFTRPEGALFALATLSAVAAAVEAGRRAALARSALAVWLVPLALHEAWRLTWYGLPLPLPYYVKLAQPGRLAGWPVVSLWLRENGLRLGPLLAFGLVRPPRSLRPALAASVAVLLFFLAPQQLMGYQHRYLAPLDPFLCVLAAVSLARVMRWCARKRGWQRAGAIVLPLAVLAIAGLELGDTRTDVPERLAYAQGLAAAHAPLGRALRRIVPHGRLALSDSGLVPYLSDWWTLDLIGLNDARIATTGARDPAWILGRHPDVIVLVSRDPDRFTPWNWNPWEAPLYAAARPAGFACVRILRFGSDYWLWVLAKPGTPTARGLAAIPGP